jgi:hypothetical protein
MKILVMYGNAAPRSGLRTYYTKQHNWIVSRREAETKAKEGTPVKERAINITNFSDGVVKKIIF